LTLCRGPTIQTEMPSVTAGIYYTMSPSLSGAMLDCSIFQVQHSASVCGEGACSAHTVDIDCL